MAITLRGNHTLVCECMSVLEVIHILTVYKHGVYLLVNCLIQKEIQLIQVLGSILQHQVSEHETFLFTVLD